MPKGMSCLAAAAVLATGTLMPCLAMADEQSGPGRFSLQPVEGGVVRLDKVTGRMSLCRVDKQGLTCTPAGEEGKRLQAEIDRLQKRVAMLEAEAKEKNVLSNALPTDKDLDQAMNVFEHLMRRVFGMVGDLNRSFRDEPSRDGGSADTPQRT